MLDILVAFTLIVIRLGLLPFYVLFLLVFIAIGVSWLLIMFTVDVITFLFGGVEDALRQLR